MKAEDVMTTRVRDHSKVGANCLLARTQSTLLLCTRPFQGGPVHERSTLPCEIRANQAVGLPPDWNGLRVQGVCLLQKCTSRMA